MMDFGWMRDAAAQMSWGTLWLLVTLEFTMIYAGFAALAYALTTHIMPKLRIGRPLDTTNLQTGQLRREITCSAVSIAIFGGYGLATWVLHERAGLAISWQVSGPRLLLDMIVFVLWNEVHFYACHRLLHTRWLYRHVHRVHHLSIVPTPFSTYSFHWFEAALLGSVMICGMSFYTYSFPALLAAPLLSLAMNTFGHWNYDAVPERSYHHLLAASRRHSLHHGRVTGNFGFMLPHLDAWLGTELPVPPTRSEPPSLQGLPSTVP